MAHLFSGGRGLSGMDIPVDSRVGELQRSSEGRRHSLYDSPAPSPRFLLGRVDKDKNGGAAIIHNLLVHVFLGIIQINKNSNPKIEKWGLRARSRPRSEKYIYVPAVNP